MVKQYAAVSLCRCAHKLPYVAAIVLTLLQLLLPPRQTFPSIFVRSQIFPLPAHVPRRVSAADTQRYPMVHNIARA